MFNKIKTAARSWKIPFTFPCAAFKAQDLTYQTKLLKVYNIYSDSVSVHYMYCVYVMYNVYNMYGVHNKHNG